jgi:maleylacetate reductase
VIVRWGIDELASVLEKLSISHALLVTTPRWASRDLPIDDRFEGAQPHAGIEGVRAALAVAEGHDGLVAMGGGSVIDTGKAVAAATDLPLVAIPTTYGGAEWTRHFATRDPVTAIKVGGTGDGTRAIVYEPELTLELPWRESCGTAMNALAHCVEGLLFGDCEDCWTGARLIDEWVPRVHADPHDLDARRNLLKGAEHGGRALAAMGMGVGHAMAQALGGRYLLPHGAMNAICLPPAMRFNGMTEPLPVERVEELATSGGFRRLRDFNVPRDELDLVAASAAERRPAKANPRQATPEAIAELLRTVW